MIIVVSWYAGDGGAPDVRSIPTCENALDKLIDVMHGLAEVSKEFRIFEIESVDKPWLELGARQLEQKESNGKRVGGS